MRTFEYTTGGLLSRVVTPGGVRVSYHYDHLGRLVGRKVIQELS